MEYNYEDQMITSSGDITWHLSTNSKIIGYSISFFFLILTFLILHKVVSLSRFWIGITLCLFLYIAIKSSECLVVGTNGMRYYVINPFYSTYIGFEVDDDWVKEVNPDPSRLEYRINSIEFKENEIVFNRTSLPIYYLNLKFLFWEYDIIGEPWPFRKTQ